MPPRLDPAAEKAQLLTRCRLTLDAFAHAEPEATSLDELRTLVEANAGRLGALRALAGELAAMASALPPSAQAELERSLIGAGVDVVGERAAEARWITEARARGRIRSEAEYRRVQAYADQLTAPEQEGEYLALGALLDEYMSRSAAALLERPPVSSSVR